MPRPDAPAAYHHGDLPAALRRAGWEVLGESGLRGLTLRECARRAGVSHAAPAHHFGSLDGLLAELAADGYARMLDRIRATQQEVNDPLLGCGLGYIRFAVDYPQQFRLMLGLDVRASGLPRLVQISEEAIAYLRETVRAQWIARHGSDPDAALLEQRTLLSWSAVHGYASLVIDGRHERLRAFAPETVMAPLLKGLLEP
ncbi:TetR/AcrR family transcriptional regulator [Xanthomonas prunicola]|uniref:TetR/AcrR family transcriptional regulator n=1 Tax=Xanthomonas prunicola TaxID=2053930 RepID=A0A9Q9J574_9XANT|nr:TetR/AcrR family transcriptional regulator [Xanthomonas prunicola]USJ01638.1 TetR/AcrR family transcriptional regulator [Xanthomonas prunicola]UXA50122.1 TetR/AcrR family transcriptional regulator [Xanthomonas prunicola]UXA52150.1 TetR/AcrR family transcriptional regulator [Xanthomonas prunicola]UXA58427.1 TetR/AcrR family transcriptional regulator [Xanthomonas prunicola]UXA60572.1 TetR/AcrR family transcriptional regulator [Xanthomonas prunicola]